MGEIVGAKTREIRAPHRFKKGNPYRFSVGNKASLGVRHGKGQGVTRALAKLLKGKYPGDKEGRTGVNVLAAELLKLAIDGNGTAIREILNRLEGPIPTVVDDDAGPVTIKVVYVNAEPAGGER